MAYLFLDDVLNAKRVKESLLGAISEMRNANERLSSGRLTRDTRVSISAEVYDLYFAEKNIKKRVDAYLDMASDLLRNETKESYDEKILELGMLSDRILPDLDRVVAQYQKEGEASIRDIKKIETIVWVMTIVTLLLEIIFIFQPMANTIKLYVENEKLQKENLEKEIQIRTCSLEQANQKLLHNATHDALTGLLNRYDFAKELETLLMHYTLHKSSFAILMLDVDFFKQINDTYGHRAGDFVLQELAAIFKDMIRLEDRAYRIGGEEFVIIFNRITPEQVMEKAEEIRLVVEKHLFQYDESHFNVTISCGVYHSKWSEPVDVHTLMKRVDNALYEAKGNGRNQVVSSFVK